MNPMVSARVPAELRDQVNERLKSIGSSPTELINAAYEFFMKTSELPKCEKAPKNGHRNLTNAQLDELMESIEATSAPVPESYFDEKAYDDILTDALKESYEALA